MAQPNILELAKQGDAKAISKLINRSLQPKSITARAALKDGCLQVMLESDQVPEELALVSFIRKSMTSLGAKSIERVKVYGRQTGEEFPAWNQEFELGTQVKSKAVQGNQSLDLPSRQGISALPQQKNVTKVVANRAHNAQAAGQTKISKNYSKTNSKDRQKSLRWYETESPVIIIALLIIFFPLGLYSMWRYSKWSLKVKLSVTGAIAFLALVSNGFEEKVPFATSPTPTPTPALNASVTKTEVPKSDQNIQQIKRGEQTFKNIQAHSSAVMQVRGGANDDATATLIIPKPLWDGLSKKDQVSLRGCLRSDRLRQSPEH